MDTPEKPELKASDLSEPVAENFIDGKWVSGNPPLMRAWSHATWMGVAIFDGARAFEGVAPDLDLHCQRAVRSAVMMGMKPPMSAQEIQEIAIEGIGKFPRGTPLYIRPFMWTETGFLALDPASTRIAVSVIERPLLSPRPYSVCLSSYRRPSAEFAPTGAKACGLYAHANVAWSEANTKGFDDAVMLDANGNVSEFAFSNIMIARNGVVHTPVPNGTFLNGITRQRVIKLLRDAGNEVQERSISYQEVLEADEIFSTGNYNKVMPVTRIENRNLDIGPLYERARRLYWEYAHSGPTV